MKKKLFMETTEVPASRTIGQITALLVEAGAREVSTQYDKAGEVIGLRFTMEVKPGVIRLFSLPSRIDPVFKIMYAKRWKTQRSDAVRVAWRQLFRWVEVQVAMIQSDMVEAAEVFLPYLDDGSGETLYKHMLDGGMLALPAPEEKTA